MRLVILSLPSNISEAEIRDALINLGIQLDVPTIKVNILEEKDIKLEDVNVAIGKDIDTILQECMNQDRLISIANFWRNISMGKINKSTLLKITKNRIALRAYLQKKQAEYFLQLFDSALTAM